MDARARSTPARDTTVRQISERLGKSRAMVADGQAEIAALTALHAAMVAAHASSIGGLTAEVRAQHHEAVRLASGLSDGVEMW